MNDLPQEELLSAYLDGELTADERARVEELLAESAEYRQLLEELRALRNNLQALPRHTLPADFSQGVLQQAERAMLLDSPARTDGATAGAGDAPQHATTMLGGRWLRPLAWAGMAVAAALLVMMMTPEEGREGDDTVVAVAPERDEQPQRDARPAPSMQAAPPSEPSAPLTKGGAGEGLPAAAPAAAPSEEAEMLAGSADEDILIVQLDVRPEAAREGAFQRLLAQQQIELQQPDYVLGGAEQETATRASEAAGPLEAELVYVEATPAQLEATLAELKQQRDVFLSVSVKAAPDDPLQTKWSETYSRLQPGQRSATYDLRQEAAEAARPAVDARRHGGRNGQTASDFDYQMKGEAAVGAPLVVIQDDDVQAELRRFVETQPLAPGEGSRAQKVVLPPSVQRELVQGQAPSLGRTATVEQRAAPEAKRSAGMSRAVFVLRVVDPEASDAEPVEPADANQSE